jgi:rhomboid-like protein
MHFGFNMFALYGFGPQAFDYLKQRRIFGYPNASEQGSININSTPHFVAFFMTCGVLANLLPHYVSLLASRSQALMRSSAANALIPRPGLGASGAVYSCLAVCAFAHPEHSVSLIFLPMVPIPIGWGFSGIVCMDAIGVIRGWHNFGHLTHLTGAAAGVSAYYCGAAAWYWGQAILRANVGPPATGKQ